MIYSSCIGRYTYTGRNFTAWHCTVGGFCSVSWNVSIGGANHDYTKTTTHAFLYSPDFGMLPEGHAPGYNRFKEKCVIGNDVWIAANACICRGVTVGDGAVVAAGAVVTKDVDPYTIVAGVPAKPVRKRFSEDIIAVLQKSKWWNYPEKVIKEHFDLFNCTPDIYTAKKILQLREKFDPEMIR
ncbi:MAG TPA: CatB-related O-acetyltransferase [Candidatus Scatavimonas merdigallinarum]|uniref:CatB-related O-acetyltransferase n=1 Tax=Candidatus Scatavimonas merdigallinarum TaxID=2840914 RepID=A0A9D0ZIW8_9FIRM|nr:CatB-related O-acetyltransferase [Candidatus Scatavimonas merdigallinarum]